MATHTSFRGRPSGFTLIELMATVAIIAIAASLAYPQYSAYLQRGRIMDATTKLSDFRIKMEQYYQDNRTYQNAGANCLRCRRPALDVHGQLRRQVRAGPGHAHQLRDRGYGHRRQEHGELHISAHRRCDGPQQDDGLTLPAGWNYPSPNNCWTTRKDGLCS